MNEAVWIGASYCPGGMTSLLVGAGLRVFLTKSFCAGVAAWVVALVLCVDIQWTIKFSGVTMKGIVGITCVALAAVSFQASAIGSRFTNYNTTTVVSSSNPYPAGGETITISAKVAAPALGVFVGNPIAGEDVGGRINFFANGVAIGQVKIGRSNTPVVGRVTELDQGCYAATQDPARCTYYFYYTKEANLSVSYTLPAQFSDVTITASFTGDSNFSKASASAPIALKNLPAFGLIKGMGNKCLDAVGGGTINGTEIQQFSCNENVQQMWTVMPGSGYIRSVPSGLVLDVKDLGSSNGNTLQLWSGLGGANQQWRFTNTAIVGIGGKVLDAVGQSSSNGTKLQIYSSLSNAGQIWNYDPISGQIQGIGGKCLDVEGGSTADGTLVQLWDCSGAPQQRWEVGERGSLRYAGKCLESANGSAQDGNPVRLWTCNGGAHQSWRFLGEIRNVGSNRCLADPGRGTTDGARTYIWDCSGDVNQKWDYSSY
ncbi:ricin-type beta-trefoil lectin domain protein [Xanthomonas bonasiae]|uniref:ricin-type beta-trefoil lectin domain protein n=1 Tax=Xanthomonas bonasiae TaxID=2810351 RepID=UPI0019809545|nr:ricin-type beta-trefoil lectin domain protein [Xanthomonas bonasiae]MBN6113304.1 ricin-type beta-trefoil lectin domain protein [Xanthomonas bonasiae]